MLIFLMPKNDRWIREMASGGMIEPFTETLKTRGVISSGISSYGYDIRLADEFKIFRPGNGHVDPKAVGPGDFTDFRGDVCTIPPNSFALGRSLEYIRVPREIIVLCFGKSTYARCGVVVNITPLEPEWEGYITISISNTAPLPAKVYSNEGIAQLVFLEADEVCLTSYADRSGKYNVQRDITLPRM
jgi:dCTP deaminase